MLTTLIILVFCGSLVGSSSVYSRAKGKYIDGSQYTPNNVGRTYKRHVSDQGQCSIEFENEPKLLTEGELTKIKSKWYKVENCQLNRAYPISCGSELLYEIRDLACSLAEQNSTNKMALRRQTKDVEGSFYNICCESACTLTELVQSCPKK